MGICVRVKKTRLIASVAFTLSGDWAGGITRNFWPLTRPSGTVTSILLPSGKFCISKFATSEHDMPILLCVALCAQPMKLGQNSGKLRWSRVCRAFQIKIDELHDSCLTLSPY